MDSEINCSGHILATGLNPAWQKTLFFDNLRFYEVNRARDVKHMASGKGVNFARAAKNWKKKEATVFQFAGGETGEKICAYLDAELISHSSVTVDKPTRTCTTCLCGSSKEMTELIEPSGEISAEASLELLTRIKKHVPESAGVALCGTFPPGISPDFYLSIAKEASKQKRPLILDAWLNVTPTLEHGVEILKINLEEIMTLTGQSSGEAAIKHCLNNYPIKIVAVTAGPEKAFLGTKDELWEFHPPRLKDVLNPIGAGDTVTAVFFSEYLAGAAPHEAFASGLAAASASCLTSQSAEFDMETALKIRNEIEIIQRNCNI